MIFHLLDAGLCSDSDLRLQVLVEIFQVFSSSGVVVILPAEKLRYSFGLCKVKPVQPRALLFETPLLLFHMFIFYKKKGSITKQLFLPSEIISVKTISEEWKNYSRL